MTSDRYTLHHGDALEVLRTLDAGSCDALVTDPPSGIAFMGAEWDRDKGGRAAWVAWLAEILTEARRVLRPGAHALVWALPRTAHWTATAVEDAGLEVRDVIVHMFGTGFPKSKSLLKPGAEHWILARVPGPRRELGIEACRIGTSKRVPGSASAKSLAGFGEREGRAGQSAADGGMNANLGRWPANVVLSHADGCDQIGTKRVRGSAPQGSGGEWQPRTGSVAEGEYDHKAVAARRADADGLETVEAWRCADGCPVAALDAQSGERRATLTGRGDPAAAHANPSDNSGASWFGAGASNVYADTGGASRFFFCSKASSAERSEGVLGHNDHPTVKSVELMRWLLRLVAPPSGLVLDPFAGSGTTGVAAMHEQRRFIGIERDEYYAKIARQRIANALGPLFAATGGAR